MSINDRVVSCMPDKLAGKEYFEKNGIFKRFPYLTTPLLFTPSTCGTVIVACDVLHNLTRCLDSKDDHDEIEFQFPDHEHPYERVNCNGSVLPSYE